MLGIRDRELQSALLDFLKKDNLPYRARGRALEALGHQVLKRTNDLSR